MNTFIYIATFSVCNAIYIPLKHIDSMAICYITVIVYRHFVPRIPTRGFSQYKIFTYKEVSALVNPIPF